MQLHYAVFLVTYQI